MLLSSYSTILSHSTTSQKLCHFQPTEHRFCELQVATTFSALHLLQRKKCTLFAFTLSVKLESVPLKGNALSSGFTPGILFPDDLWVLKWHVDFFVVLVFQSLDIVSKPNFKRVSFFFSFNPKLETN